MLDCQEESIQQQAHQKIPAIQPMTVDLHQHQQASRWLVENRAWLSAQLQTQGYAYLRGLSVFTPEDLHQAVSALPGQAFPYEKSLSNALRVDLTDRVFTANEAPAHYTIDLHHEMVQTPFYPDILLFNCQLAADLGGATTVCDSRAVYSGILQKAPGFIEKLERYGVRYTQEFSGFNKQDSAQGRSWAHLFKVDQLPIDQQESAAESTMSRLGYTWRWLDQGNELPDLLLTSPQLPALALNHQQQGVFFNQLIAAFLGWSELTTSQTPMLTYGNNESIEMDYLEIMANVGRDLTQAIAWQAGDLVILNNHLVMHGRSAFKGQRKVYATMVELDPTTTDFIHMNDSLLGENYVH